MDFIKSTLDYSRDGWLSGAAVAIVLMIIIMVIMYFKNRSPSEHVSNRDFLGERLMFAKQIADPLSSAKLFDVEKFGRGDESDSPYQTHGMNSFEHLSDSNEYLYQKDRNEYLSFDDIDDAGKLSERQNNNELIDLLYA